MKGDWTHYRFNQICAICGHKGGSCKYKGTLTDPISVMCFRIAEGAARALRDGMGWIHDLHKVPFRRKPPKQAPARDPEPDASIAPLAALAMASVNVDDVEMLANMLGVSAFALMRLGVGWLKYDDADKVINAWTFPMRDHRHNIIGIRTRNAMGRKWAIRGSLNGLFIMEVASFGYDPLMIVEGPTETAAVYDLGFDVIGRPGNTSGRELIIKYLLCHTKRNVVIFKNNDPAGSDAQRLTNLGAMNLAVDIKRQRAAKSVKIIAPPATKDARDWKNCGATGEMIMELVSRTCAT